MTSDPLVELNGCLTLLKHIAILYQDQCHIFAIV